MALDQPAKPYDNRQVIPDSQFLLVLRVDAHKAVYDQRENAIAVYSPTAARMYTFVMRYADNR